jgi:hypothetical protein
MSAACQLALFVDVAQKRARRKESPRLYGAICYLRRIGYPVWRRGGQHLVRGRQVTTRELFMLADHVLPMHIDG